MGVISSSTIFLPKKTARLYQKENFNKGKQKITFSPCILI